ncbi:hypothetical protein ETAA8_57110 [Anatilimnocola aggregata]|uniref:Methane oxygenase PmoA n=1 Tax=Anatilimnocola aggregata TaxID=2528021 RepID=A0A517YK17_9BACT|nr:PmoA family protein [Anatilimnocola aggregata]QDU30565.1 hypothetical protein ETAA8_57110 [Anatilimnocola aggregata]
MKFLTSLVCLVATACLALPLSAGELTVEKKDDGVVVKADGKPFATYVFKSGTKPIVWPIIGPTGQEMTRSWPLKDGVEGEKKDHIHHRSFWFTHGNVNGVDFWGEVAKVQGLINHKELIKAEGGSTAVISTRNEWVGPDGKVICQDEPTLTFGANDNARWIDFATKVTAVADEVTFGDTKEGAFGVRVSETMKVDANKGGKIVTSEGLSDKAAWGMPAKWVDYHGPVGTETLGIAIFDHPSSFRHPTTWHVRTYGLFAPNPFGLHDFPNGKDRNGAHTMKKGETFALKYRVYFHKGDEKEGKVAEAYAKFAAE